jgi:hypothetical protein
MNLRRKTTLIATAIAAVCLAASVVMLGPLQRVQAASDSEEMIYIPSAHAIKAMSLGYTGLAAAIYWTRAVQYFGRHHVEQANSFPLLAPLLDLTTELDPKMTVAYQFGGMFLAPKPPEGAGQPDKAVALVERGIKANPDNWHLYLTLGFIHYQERHDMEAAAAAFERGSHVPGAHPALKILAATVTQEGGDAQKANLLWHAIYDSTSDESIKKNALQHLVAMKVDAQVAQLQAIVMEFQRRTGRFPSNFAEMAASGWLRGIPADPTGHPYQLTPEGRVEVESVKDLPYITQGIPAGAKDEVKVGLPVSH